MVRDPHPAVVGGQLVEHVAGDDRDRGRGVHRDFCADALDEGFIGGGTIMQSVDIFLEILMGHYTVYVNYFKDTVETGYKVAFCPIGKLPYTLIYLVTDQNSLYVGIYLLYLISGYFISGFYCTVIIGYCENLLL